MSLRTAFHVLLVLSAVFLLNYHDSLAQAHKLVVFDVSNLYRSLTGSNGISRIGGTNIYLGPIPFSEHRHELLGTVDVVLAIVEDWELDGTRLSRTVHPTEWKAHGVIFHQVSVADHEPLTAGQMGDAMSLLQNALDANRTVYVHCKAGRGRSASVVIAYLMVKHHVSFVAAEAYVRHWRPRISVNARQRGAVEWYVYDLRRRRCQSLGGYMHMTGTNLMCGKDMVMENLAMMPGQDQLTFAWLTEFLPLLLVRLVAIALKLLLSALIQLFINPLQAIANFVTSFFVFLVK